MSSRKYKRSHESGICRVVFFTGLAIWLLLPLIDRATAPIRVKTDNSRQRASWIVGSEAFGNKPGMIAKENLNWWCPRTGRWPTGSGGTRGLERDTTSHRVSTAGATCRSASILPHLLRDETDLRNV